MKRLVYFFAFLVYFPGHAQQVMVTPFLQPGDAPSLSREHKVLVWQTDNTPAEFTVEYAAGPTLEGVGQLVTAKVTSVELDLIMKSILYRATFSGLNFDAQYTYRVRLGDKIISTATFNTRTRKPATRFSVFGDCGVGSKEQAAIAYQVYLQKPQFVLITGDNVYSSGLETEYRARFFPYYAAAQPSETRGVPLMQSVPFYMMLGNHDVRSANLRQFKDGLAFFYYTDLPMNAPRTVMEIKATGDKTVVKAFEKATEGRFPKLANYSFQNGNVQIFMLDANAYINPVDFTLVDWMREEVRLNRSDWNIVVFHHPGFNSSIAHYDYQRMRLLAPKLEAMGIDMVLSGHVHNYQRTVPLKFEPKTNRTGERYIISAEGRVDGKFTLDHKFDGITDTTPDGIIYIVTGAGGAGLYDQPISGNPELWKHESEENWVPFTVKLISDIHSFTMIETDGKKLTLKQLDMEGTVIDQIIVTK
ncbi:MAG: metallophosphoesterase family protein [Cytophagales bacterium]|nr:metallophosphoesterase family protein [Cytophagales bacterium]